jgi:hypothetical protein
MAEKPIVFVSCGQVTDEEKYLGDEICRLIREVTPFEPYFAEYQADLEGLSRNILNALNKAVGLVAVMHPRGTVTSNTGRQHIRASVWIEQEIAIAAYLTQIAGKKMSVVAYQHETIGREGMREQIILNPRVFRSPKELLLDLAGVLPSWTATRQGSGVSVELAYREHRISQELHQYQLYVSLLNNGSEVVKNYHLDVSFPSKYLDSGMSFAGEVRDRHSSTERTFRVTSEGSGALFPGDSVRAMTLDYYVDRRIYHQTNGVFRENVTVKLYVSGEDPVEVVKSMQELQNF